MGTWFMPEELPDPLLLPEVPDSDGAIREATECQSVQEARGQSLAGEARTGQGALHV